MANVWGRTDRGSQTVGGRAGGAAPSSSRSRAPPLHSATATPFLVGPGENLALFLVHAASGLPARLPELARGVLPQVVQAEFEPLARDPARIGSQEECGRGTHQGADNEARNKKAATANCGVVRLFSVKDFVGHANTPQQGSFLLEGTPGGRPVQRPGYRLTTPMGSPNFQCHQEIGLPPC